MASTSSTAPQSEISYAFDELAPPSASASATTSSPLQKLPYDVFINHRGPDVKQTLARSIYNPLDAMGLRVFLDSEELELGDFLPAALEAAMRSASLHIAIFSSGYAQSPWCLAELSFMLKTGTPIIPVFYHVQPTDLRWVAKGKYANAFLKHQEKGRYTLEKLQEWKEALHNVSFYMGEIIDNNGEEQRVLKNIVNRASKVMKIVPLEVAKHPVGLKEAVADFEMTLSESIKVQPNVQVVGIWGMGGSGKTTLAKELYNQKHSSIGRSAFVFEIRDAKSKLHEKQIQLLHDLGFNDQPINNIEQGKGILSNRLRSIGVLVVLDDVDHIDQLEALLPTKDNLGWGSLIIVTTREREVLKCWGISSIYEMKPMNRTHAKQLFCWHAFLQPSPPPGFLELVEDFLNACYGLPLSLKVLGGQLYGCSSKDLWKSLLHKITRILPKDIINRLRVSYDALDEEEKQMFLDVACFFIGKDKMTAIAIWDGSGWSGLYGWETLVNKCLVDFDNNNIIKMHDHLRDLGREIAKTELPCRLWSSNQITGFQNQTQVWLIHSFLCCLPCRLWFPDQITGFQNQMEIRGMLLNETTSGVHIFPAQLHELKVFVVGENYGNSLHVVKLSRELAWLSCTGIVHRNLPSWLPFKNLRVLELHDCPNIVGLWKDGAEAPMQLRVLIISNCCNLARIPMSIGHLESLKKISLDWCNVENLPEEFCRLQSLEHLQSSSCQRLSSLPNCFGSLTNLRHLDLSYCDTLKILPYSFKQLTLLEHLNLGSCGMLTLQSDILENMTKLEYLNLDRCRQLEELPRHITNQASLCELYLKGTRLRELPINIGQLSKLRVMELCPDKGCFQMQSLPDSMGCLNHLNQLVLRNLEVQSLPLKQLINLQTLEISECPISGLDFRHSSLRNLKEIELDNTRVSKISISGDCCPGLHRLAVWNSEHLTEVDTLPTAVEDILVNGCKSLRNISGIGGVVNLRKLILWNCPELDTCPSFDKLVNLQKLQLRDCPELDTLPSFDKLASLEVFELTGGNKVEKVQGLQHCTSLEKLEVHCKCLEVPGIESLEHVQRLRSLKLVAKKRSAVELCIQTIQKWPEEIMICTKAVSGAGSLLNSSAFPSLSVLDSFANRKIVCDSFAKPDRASLRLQQNHPSNGNAMMLCVLINCVSPRMRLFIDTDNVGTIFSTDVEEGKWILIGVFTQHSTCLTTKHFIIGQSRWEESKPHEDNDEVEKGMVVRGEEGSVGEAFRGVLTLLAS